MAIKLKNYILI